MVEENRKSFKLSIGTLLKEILAVFIENFEIEYRQISMKKLSIFGRGWILMQQTSWLKLESNPFL